MSSMGQVLPLPSRGEVLIDPRGEGRTLRVSGHPDAATVVLSVWEYNQCRATFRLAANQVDALVRAILTAAPPSAPEPGVPDGPTLSSVVALDEVAAGGQLESAPPTFPGRPDLATSGELPRDQAG